MSRTLVAGIGNIFCRDDGFGSEVARCLLREEPAHGVTVVDYGIRGMHLALDLLEGFDRLIVIDTWPGRGSPGEVTVLEVTADDVAGGVWDAHGMAPTDVLAGVVAQGGVLPKTVIVACEPLDLSEGMGLSDVVAASVAAAADTVRALTRSEGTSCTS
jgi:hydrogenase maturation protease